MKKIINLVLVVMAALMLSGCEVKQSYERDVEIVGQPVKIETKKDVVVHKSEYGYHVHIENMSHPFTTDQYVINADGDYEFELNGIVYSAKFIIHNRNIALIEKKAENTYCPICGRVVD